MYDDDAKDKVWHKNNESNAVGILILKTIFVLYFEGGITNSNNIFNTSIVKLIISDIEHVTRTELTRLSKKYIQNKMQMASAKHIHFFFNKKLCVSLELGTMSKSTFIKRVIAH